jgi:hypothetical protein
MPASLRTKLIAEWSAEETIRICIGNAAIRARASLLDALKADDNLVRTVEGDDRTFVCFRLALPQESPAVRKPVIMRSG